MNSHIEEIFAGGVASLAYAFAHCTGMKFEMLNANVMHVPFSMADKLTNVAFGVATAVIAYFAVYLIKRFITHEEIKTTKKKGK